MNGHIVPNLSDFLDAFIILLLLQHIFPFGYRSKIHNIDFAHKVHKLGCHMCPLLYDHKIEAIENVELLLCKEILICM
jgi:hypothetical protein